MINDISSEATTFKQHRDSLFCWLQSSHSQDMKAPRVTKVLLLGFPDVNRFPSFVVEGLVWFGKVRVMTSPKLFDVKGGCVSDEIDRKH